jgi:sec-independent protein translocase protein TatA
VIALIPNIGWQEMFLLLVIGLLLYGRNLPDAGRSLGRVLAQLKRSFHDFKDQLDRDGQLSDVKKALKDTAREVKNVANVPRAFSKPGDALRDLTHEAMKSPVDEPVVDAVEDAVVELSDDPVDEAVIGPVGDASDEPVVVNPEVAPEVAPEGDKRSVAESADEPKPSSDKGVERDETSTPATGNPGA